MVDRPLNEWLTDDILTLRAIRRKNELIWRKTRTTINFDMYYDSCKAVKKAISKRKSELMEQRVINCEGDSKKKLFSLYTISNLGVKRVQCCQKCCLPVYSFVDIDIIITEMHFPVMFCQVLFAN